MFGFLKGNGPYHLQDVTRPSVFVLLYKSHERTEKDEADSRAVLPHLSPTATGWLARALEETTPEHPKAAFSKPQNW
jgi:hypothetical protein